MSHKFFARTIWARWFGLSIAVTAVVAAMHLFTVPTASASVSEQHVAADTAIRASPCGTHTKSGHVVRNYTDRYGDHHPLRCGSKGWGWRHIKDRWNPWFADMIGVTMEMPTQVERSGTTIVYKLRVGECERPYTFRVVVQTAKHHMGIITAYQQFDK